MIITAAIQKGTAIHVLDGQGRIAFSKGAGTKPTDGLVGFTSHSVSIRLGATIYTYDAQGRLMFSTAAGK